MLSIAPDLRYIQIESFQNFLLTMLPLTLNNLGNLIYKNLKFELKLEGNQYRFETPQYNENEAIYQIATFSSNLYIPAYIYDQQQEEIDIQTILLGSIPLMTGNGTFIINGIYRCMVTQVIRSPGIYFTLNSEELYTGTIITNSGKRLKLQLDSYGAIWIIFNNSVQISFPTLLLGLGLERDEIPSIFQHWIFDELEKEQPEIPTSIEEASIYIYSIIRPSLSRPNNYHGSQPFLKIFLEIFLSEYELGTIGRLNFNRRLDLNIQENEIYLCIEDFIYAGFHLLDLWRGAKSLDDIDDLKHKRVRRAGDLIHEQIRNSFDILSNKIQSFFKKKALKKRKLNPTYFFYSSPLNLEGFLSSFELSQFIDQTNPLAEIVHKRKLSALGPGGLTPRTARFRVRDIHPSQYGRICPIETAEGQNAGIVTSFTMSAQIDELGRIQNLVYEISGTCMTGNARYLIANDDEYFKIATGRCLLPNLENEQTSLTPVQNRREFLTMSWDEVNFRSLLPLHYFSIGVSLIPFLEHDDSTRALMGSNMQRQAVSLLNPERPIVGTGIESLIALDSGTIITAKEDAYVQYVDENHILLRSLQTKALSDIHLIKHARLNNNICMYQQPRVRKGQYIRQGQLIADSNTTVGGELALGKNILVAYMPWEGYNFEDAILINERLVHEDIYTSLNIKRYETEFRKTDEAIETLTNKIPYIDQYLLRHLDDNGLAKIGSSVQPGDILVGKIIIKQSEEAPTYGVSSRLLQDIFGIEAINTREKCLRVPVRGGGKVVDIRFLNYENPTFGQVYIVQVYILQERKLQVGDKLAGRHGNKGVVSRILPREKMPYLQDGTSIDMILSPLGVPSRMNVGQVFECLLGLAGFCIGKNYRILPFDERYEKEASRKLIFTELYKASQVTNNPWLFESINPGKIRLFDGRTGKMFDQAVTVGKAYMFKLIHQVDDKIHARSTGPYAIVTQQPVRGKSRKGGQRVGEMEVWAFQGFGAAYALQEILTTKSDHIQARSAVLNTSASGKPIDITTTPSDCLRALTRELRSLGINIDQTIVSEDTGKFSSTEF